MLPKICGLLALCAALCELSGGRCDSIQGPGLHQQLGRESVTALRSFEACSQRWPRSLSEPIVRLGWLPGSRLGSGLALAWHLSPLLLPTEPPTSVISWNWSQPMGLMTPRRSPSLHARPGRREHLGHGLLSKHAFLICRALAHPCFCDTYTALVMPIWLSYGLAAVRGAHRSGRHKSVRSGSYSE